ncbi:MAG TPA: ABC transporter substrate-binding protein [Opitutaceae bacterium]|jgi:NitT/TauT family transport system substrate-binding protein|nr:ABC transporter substrate-binding protein [Opitutaceae bacterium]
MMPVSLQADWFAEAEQAGNYQALARGFYRQAGLDVTILDGGPGGFPLQKVAEGQADMALGRSDDVILAVARSHLPLVILCAYMEKDPMAVLVHAASPVRGFRDMAGKTVMADPASAWVPYLKARYHMEFGLVADNYGLSEFMVEPNLIVQGFATNEPYYLRLHGVPTRTLLIADSGYNPYRVIYSNQGFVRDHPDAARAFVAATLRGWNDFLTGDPTPGESMIYARNRSITPAFMAFSIRAMAEDHLLRGNPARGERLGLITRRRLQEQVDLFWKLKVIETRIPVDAFATFAFLPPDLAALAQN